MKKIFTVVLCLLVLGEIIRLEFGSGFVLKPLDIGVGITVVFWLISKLLKKEKIKHRQIYIPVLLFSGLGFFSLSINYFNLTVGQFFISLMYLVRWVAYAGVFFVISDFDKQFKKRISNMLIIVGILIVASGYVQYFFYPSLISLLYLGWDKHMYRMFSVFLDPNFAGAFFVLFFLFLLNIFLKKKSLLVGLFLTLTLVSVFLTFSRSALILLIISSSFLFILLNKKAWIILLLGITILVLLISSRYFNIENINLFRTVSTEARLETAGNAVLIIEKNPLIGIGFNAYRYAQVRYGFRNDAVLSHADAAPDNSFLFVLATTGVLGFSSFVFLWFRILKQEYRINPLFTASVIGIFVDSLFINSLFYPSIMLWLWVILAL